MMAFFKNVFILLFINDEKTDKFEQFSSTSGLVANRGKSEIFFAGVSEPKKREIAAFAQLQEGRLPFRYLGIPLNAKRLSVLQYQPLLEKIMGKIRHWTSHLLSYGGRLQLVQSVLFSIQNYWSQVFYFPKKVMKTVNMICRQFLWSGELGGRKAPVSWDDVCGSKAEGGLGLVHLETWNKICILKMLWAITLKADKLWVQWIHAVYIKNCSVMDMDVPNNASYFFKKMMKLRSFVKDAPDWRVQQSTPNFLGKKFYELLRPSITKVNWKEFMMNNFASPKAKLILWLALRGRLATKERLAKFTTLPDINCVFCNSDIESVNHITLNCSVVQQVWKAIMAWFGDPSIISVGQSDIQQMAVKIRGEKPARRLLKALITELIYAIWLARNKKIFQGTAADFNQILRNVVQKTFCRGNMHSNLVDLCNSFQNYPILL
ncbi:hypothetical protein OROGR_006310 [Orobanche gracilis]